jgi:enoyl-CoA hydratase/carnithine racemase
LSAVREARGLDFETITYSMEDRVATIAFNRPDQLNAISLGMKNELGRAFAAAEADADVWPIIVTGNGRAFGAGADEIPSGKREPKWTAS